MRCEYSPVLPPGHFKPRFAFAVLLRLSLSLQGIIFMIAFYEFKQALYEGESEQTFEGSVMCV